jgi:two-component system response regulator (stage 0 sporulation protein A)
MINTDISIETKTVTMSLDDYNKYVLPVLLGKSEVVEEKQPQPEQQKSIEQEVTDMLAKMGVRRNLMGFNYLRDAIILCVDTPKFINNITKDLYPAIARIHTTTDSKVERAMRHSIESAFSTGNLAYIDSIFKHIVNPNKSKVTNSEFTATIADMLRLKKGSYWYGK